MSFVKSADTKSPVANSRAEIEKILRRYGATGFSVQQSFSEKQEPEGVNLSFIVPDKPGSSARVPVSLPVNVKAIYDALYGRPTKYLHAQSKEQAESWGGKWQRIVFNPNGYDPKKLAQAERVAWRNLVLWIDAALSAASVGLQTITEAFFAHTVIQMEDGGKARLVDYLEQSQGALAPGIRGLLASPADIEDAE